MAHRTFFSFYYGEDVWRASQVRKSGALKSGDVEFIEAGLWEKAKATGDAAVKKLIDDGLKNTSVTVVLIGSNTAGRRWVKYEIEQSVALGKGLVGVYIHNIKDSLQRTASKGTNPLPAGYDTHDWVSDNGYKNLGTWVDSAYDAAN